MDLGRLFRLLVIGDLLLLVFLFASGFLESDAVVAFNETHSPFSPDADGTVIVIILIAMLVLYLVTIGLLLFFVNAGRWLYLIGIVTGTILVFFIGPTATDPLQSVLESVGLILQGAIVTLMFFTPVRDRFTKRGQQEIPDPKIFA